jgi:hypothetical protein
LCKTGLKEPVEIEGGNTGKNRETAKRLENSRLISMR